MSKKISPQKKRVPKAALHENQKAKPLSHERHRARTSTLRVDMKKHSKNQHRKLKSKRTIEYTENHLMVNDPSLPPIEIKDCHFLDTPVNEGQIPHRGAFSTTNIPKGTVLVHCNGDIFSTEEALHRGSVFYQLTLDNKRVIDASGAVNYLQGSDEEWNYRWEYFNHSSFCQAIFNKIKINGRLIPVIIATEDIPAGTQIFADYRRGYPFDLNCLLYPSPDHTMPINKFSQENAEWYDPCPESLLPELQSLFQEIGYSLPNGAKIMVPKCMHAVLSRNFESHKGVLSSAHLPLIIVDSENHPLPYSQQPWIRSLHVAAFMKSRQWVDKLLDQNDPRLPIFTSGHTALHLLLSRSYDDSLEDIYQQIVSKVPINQFLEMEFKSANQLENKTIHFLAIDHNRTDFLEKFLAQEDKNDRISLKISLRSPDYGRSALNLLGYSLLHDRSNDFSCFRRVYTHFYQNEKHKEDKIFRALQLSLGLLSRFELEGNTQCAPKIFEILHLRESDTNDALNTIKFFLNGLSARIPSLKKTDHRLFRILSDVQDLKQLKHDLITMVVYYTRYPVDEAVLQNASLPMRAYINDLLGSKSSILAEKQSMQTTAVDHHFVEPLLSNIEVAETEAMPILQSEDPPTHGSPFSSEERPLQETETEMDIGETPPEAEENRTSKRQRIQGPINELIPMPQQHLIISEQNWTISQQDWETILPSSEYPLIDQLSDSSEERFLQETSSTEMDVGEAPSEAENGPLQEASSTEIDVDETPSETEENRPPKYQRIQGPSSESGPINGLIPMSQQHLAMSRQYWARSQQYWKMSQQYLTMSQQYLAMSQPTTPKAPTFKQTKEIRGPICTGGNKNNICYCCNNAQNKQRPKPLCSGCSRKTKNTLPLVGCQGELDGISYYHLCDGVRFHPVQRQFSWLIDFKKNTTYDESRPYSPRELSLTLKHTHYYRDIGALNFFLTDPTFSEYRKRPLMLHFPFSLENKYQPIRDAFDTHNIPYTYERSYPAPSVATIKTPFSLEDLCIHLEIKELLTSIVDQNTLPINHKKKPPIQDQSDLALNSFTKIAPMPDLRNLFGMPSQNSSAKPPKPPKPPESKALKKIAPKETAPTPYPSINLFGIPSQDSSAKPPELKVPKKIAPKETGPTPEPGQDLDEGFTLNLGTK